MSRTSVLLADDHVMLLDVLVHLLQQDFDVLGTARDGRSLIEMARKNRPDVIVMDIAMPSLNGIDATRILQKEALFSQNSVSFDALPTFSSSKRPFALEPPASCSKSVMRRSL